MSAYVVEVSPSALGDLVEIKAYISTELSSPAAAERTVQRLLGAIEKLERFPLRNRVVATLPDGRELRRAKSGNYLALYTVVERIVSVIAVIYGKSDVERRIAGLFQSDGSRSDELE